MADPLGHDFPWDRPLKHRRGSPQRLEGIDLYYDFGWYTLFPDRRAQFQGGKCLAQLARREAPEGKTPALLLTDREVERRVIETDSHYLVVVNLPRYLDQPTADPALSFYARSLGPGITSATELHALAAQPEVVDAVMARELDLDHITAWAADNEDRIEQLRQIARVTEPAQARAGLLSAIGAIETLGELDAEAVAAIEGLLGRAVDREARARFIRALTADRTGRYVTSEVIGERIGERLADARAVADEYVALLEAPGSTETDLQRFIETKPWLLGLDYTRIRARRALPRGTMDFILERYDGFHDLLELKSPQDPIIVAPDEVDGLPPHPSKFSLSRDLGQALAQVHVYRDMLSQDAETMRVRYGLQNTPDPRVIIVIGRADALQPHRARVLREMNLSLHRVEIVPYDILGTVLQNVEHYLTASKEDR
jgi:Domain of unknown function (DUF4263)